MFNLKKILSGSVLALALGACGAAFAGPSYHVTIDTAKLGSATAFLDIGLGAKDGVTPVTATVTGFKGMFGEYSDRFGNSTGDVVNGLTLVSDVNFSDLFQSIMLGGLFSFDVSFASAAANGNPDGSAFTATLYNGDASATLGAMGALAEIDVIPGQADIVSSANAYASIGTNAVSAVPEPSTLLSMVTGLGLAGIAGLRRRKAA
jgi:hypothetical protein